jgi:CRP-like cAMP-binding protein
MRNASAKGCRDYPFLASAPPGSSAERVWLGETLELHSRRYQLTAQSTRVIADAAVLTYHDPGEVIVQASRRNEMVGFVASGVASIAVPRGLGRGIIQLLWPGDSFCVPTLATALPTTSVDVSAHTEAVVALVSTSRLGEIYERQGSGSILSLLSAQDRRHFRALLGRIIASDLDVEDNLLQHIRAVARRSPRTTPEGDVDLCIRLKQQEWADLVWSTRPTVCRAMDSLCARHRLRKVGRRIYYRSPIRMAPTSGDRSSARA